MIASMRPPEFTGGNAAAGVVGAPDIGASMRPPEFTGGNTRLEAPLPACPTAGFNEAAGIHRRKHLAILPAKPAPLTLQ